MLRRFWFRPPGPLLRRIGPLARGKARPGAQARVDAPVIAVGSLTLGGTGKMPTTIAIAQRLLMRGCAPHIVTPGPGAPLRVSEREHGVEEVGDEPLLMAAFAPTWVAQDVAAGARAAIGAGTEVVILAHAAPFSPVRADVTVLVEDARKGFGNGFAWPLGPNRAPLAEGLAGVDLLVSVGGGFPHPVPCPVAPARMQPLQTGIDWEGQDVVAFAGIGAPERFFSTLKRLGANIVQARALTDHQELTPALLTRLEQEARLRGAQLVTTEKDAVRLPARFRQNVVSLPVRLELDDWSALDALLPVTRPTGPQ